jgi:ribonuclease P protein component
VSPAGGDVAPRRRDLPRRRRLKRQRLIRPLFDGGRPDVETVRIGPLTARFRIVPAGETGTQAGLQVGFAVGRGVGTKPARNRVKRAMREAFRVHQHGLVDLFAARPDTLTLMLLYRGPAAGAADSIRRALPRALTRIKAHIAGPVELPPPTEQPQ